MTPYQTLLIQHNRLLGEFIGTLEGLIVNDIDKQLKLILEAKLAYLRNKEKELDYDKEK